MRLATRNTASVELIHARRGTANPTVHTEHALHPRSLLVGAGLGAERREPTSVKGSGWLPPALAWVQRTCWEPAVSVTGRGGLRFLPPIPTNP